MNIQEGVRVERGQSQWNPALAAQSGQGATQAHQPRIVADQPFNALGAARALEVPQNQAARAGAQALAPQANKAAPAEPVPGQVTRTPVEGEFIVAYTSDSAESAESLKLVMRNLRDSDAVRLVGSVQRGDRYMTVAHMKSSADVETLRKRLGRTLERSERRVAWIQPNYEYTGDIKDVMPTTEQVQAPKDPKFSDQWHHEAMGTLQAWGVTRGSDRVIVQVNDDGHSLDHEDLKGQFWVNKNEVPGNMRDDDGDGYADNIEGLDLSSYDMDPRPSGSWDNHGTHVDGIINASANNDTGVAGVAPGTKVMPVRWAGSGRWTSDKIAAAYLYGGVRQVDVINASYNSNGWVGDKVVEEALDYAYDQGVLLVNSAGNGYQRDPVRQALKQVILVASTKQGDVKSGFSNYGTGVDIAAPGEGIMSTVNDNGYQNMSGTSMAAPNFGAAAALMFSAHPQWTRAQVIDHLYGTADNIDEQNPRLVGQLGAGRVNIGRALTTTDNPAPAVAARVERGLLKVRLMNGVFEDKVANNSDAWTLHLKRFGPDKQIDISAETPYKLGTNEMVFDVSNLEPGTYRFRAKAKHLEDPFGQSLDGKSTTTVEPDHIFDRFGDDYVFEFTVPEPTTTKPKP